MHLIVLNLVGSVLVVARTHSSLLFYSEVGRGYQLR